MPLELLAPVSELMYIYKQSDSVGLITDSKAVINNLKDVILEQKAKIVIYIGNRKNQ